MALTIGWKIATFNANIASLRYRSIIPILALEEKNITSKVFKHREPQYLSKLDALIIVKSFTIHDYWLAVKSQASGIPVIFDLCDNIFIEEYTYKNDLSPSHVFLMIAMRTATAITVTTEPLANIVRTHIGDTVPIYVIPDGIENDKNLKLCSNKLKFFFLVDLIGRSTSIKPIQQFLHSLRNNKTPFRFVLSKSKSRMLRYTSNSAQKIRNTFRKIKFPRKLYTQNNIRPTNLVTNSSPRKTILWFGNHGADHAQFGMLDLLGIKSELEKIALNISVELVVVSNNFDKYKQHIKPMAIDSRYVEWSQNTIDAEIRRADVVVIPNSLDDFSICKSANRAVRALCLGTPVVATKTSALKDFDGCIAFDDFELGIRRYLTDQALAESHILKSSELIQQLYGQDAIARHWINVIEHARKSPRVPDDLFEQTPNVVFGINLIQDLPLIFPIIEEVKLQNLQCSVWLTISVAKQYPNILYELHKHNVDWDLFTDDFTEIKKNGFPQSVSALFFATESNLNPHRFTHQLAKIANKHALFTATMQHGYENIGLSYSDPIHDIKDITFASQNVFTWGSMETLHSEISFATRQKCIAVGCPKPITDGTTLSQVKQDKTTFNIGIFENLHWHRYSEEYRTLFISALQQTANAYPNVTFIVKPHNAGLWLTNRNNGGIPEAGNIIIADPNLPEWKGITAPQMLPILNAVITTPSTVALDAARAAKPTAVVDFGLGLDNYAPLCLLHNITDWLSFIDQALDKHKNTMLQEHSRHFVERVLVPDDNPAREIARQIKLKTLHRNENAT